MSRPLDCDLFSLAIQMRDYPYAITAMLGNPRIISLPKGTTLLGLLELFQDVISKLEEFKSWKSLINRLCSAPAA